MKQILLIVLLLVSGLLAGSKPVVGDVWLNDNKDPFDNFKSYFLITDIKANTDGIVFVKYLDRSNRYNIVNSGSDYEDLFIIYAKFQRKANYQDSVFFKLKGVKK
jgi:hypothetical protein